MFPLKIALSCVAENKCCITSILKNMFAPIVAEFANIDELFKDHSELPFCLLLCEVRNDSDLRQLEKIGNRYPGYPVMAILDLTASSSMIVRTMRAGAAQVVQTPLEEEDITAALNRIAVQYGFPPTLGRSIAVLGSKEGCGATTLAINLANQIALQTPTKKTTLIEANPTFGCIAMRMGLQPATNVGDLIRNPDLLNLNEVLNAGCMINSNFQVLPGPHTAVQTQPAIMSMLPRLTGFARQYADTVVIDMPYQYSPVFRNILEDVSDILIVGEQSVSSIHNMQVILNMLIDNHTPAIRNVVVNKYKKQRKDFHSEMIRELLGIDSIFLVQDDFAKVSDAEDNGEVLAGATRSTGIMADLRDLAHFYRLSDSEGAPLIEQPPMTAAAPNTPTFSFR